MEIVEWLTLLLAAFAKLAGVMALITVIVAALKKFGVINDQQTDIALKVLGLIAFVVFAIVQGVLGIPIPPVVDEIAAFLAELLAALLGIALIADRVFGTRLGERATSLLFRT